MKKQACGHEKPHYAHGLCKLCYDKQWRTPEKHRIYNLRHQRGLEAEEYQSLLDAQHGSVLSVVEQKYFEAINIYL